MNIGEKIKEIRKSKKLTQAQLAKQINKSERMLQKYENGEVTPSFEVIEIIAAAFGVKPYELMDFGKLKEEADTIEETEKLLNILGYELKNIAPSGAPTLGGADELAKLIENDKIPIYEIYSNDKLITELTNSQFNKLKENIKFILDYELYKLNHK
ncbi:helix-turn-helix transcriptional regulator [Clostridium sporogenes]|uniref:helix-turn-helix domain-containing protein n=1 Tax=Clostridium sporogenes TaxID=1509 RepID=UPI0013CC9C8A|nr:helix-turn-helix transcriptional regulator [Clostridium sporogenes]NFT04109.1 helix-turn-helix transcriptional regulator [Clostridium sporogenes]NFT31294.1 helix-turn-helix transcriptional regulator [Clostridium sporogenes]NFT39533.1 helix-turn-helix transcriptional regulator [Clostridium sporogenes]NFT54596.1 helix-turn-helix transcriptional regulator [Clostridium sporogenes]NFT75763.1 helix-turn-helix transcriptional regulator [Clostridium sporogenes]